MSRGPPVPVRVQAGVAIGVCGWIEAEVGGKQLTTFLRSKKRNSATFTKAYFLLTSTHRSRVVRSRKQCLRLLSRRIRQAPEFPTTTIVTGQDLMVHHLER